VSAKQPSDHPTRAAALDPARSFLIQAPAGSGKTELLTDRILALLDTVERPEEIVAITFTRKAAAEMHARVLAKLRDGQDSEEPSGQASSGEDHRARSRALARKAMRRNDEKGWDILHYPARLSIRTIDAFCAHLVRSMPWLSHLGGMPVIAENAQEHYMAAAQATLAMVEDEPDVAALLQHMDVDGRAAQALLATGLASRDQWMPLLYAGDDAVQLSRNLNDAIGRELALLARLMPAGWAGELGACVSAAARHVAATRGKLDLRALQDWDGTPFGTDPAVDLPRWRALANVLLTAKDTLREKITVEQGFEAKSAGKKEFVAWMDGVRGGPLDWVSALGNIRKAPERGYTAEQLETLAALLGVLRLASAQLQLRFMDTGEVDFIEIAQRAVDALGQADDPSDLLLRLDASIKHILVDEFQDTSHAQIRLLESLTAGWSAGDGRTLFVVGDPMQSIYRFRKAEVGLFLKIQESGLNHISLQALRLTDNFRSRKGLVDWVNQTFAPLFPARDDAALGAISYTGSRAFHDEDDDEAVDFHPIALDGDDPDADARRTEALVVRLVKQALARSPGSAHPVAVLVRARSHLEKVLRCLAQEGIECRAVELEPLKSRQVIDDLVQLARAFSHDADRLAWLSVLRSPMCGLTLHSLHALFGADHRATVPWLLGRWLRSGNTEPGLADDDAVRLRRAAAILLDRGNRAGAVPFAAWLEQCWQRLGGPAVYSGQGDGADAERFFRLIEKLAPYGGLDPAQLEARLDGLYASSGSSGPAVEVMTIHKSKGLEFDTVVLMGLHSRPAADRPPLVRFEMDDERILLGPIKHRALEGSDPVSDYLARRDKQRGDYETDRLLYVAATRARERLHLVGTVALDDDQDFRPPAAGSLLGHLWPHIGRLIQQARARGAFEPSGSPAPSPEDDAPPAAQSLVRLAAGALPEPPPAPALPAPGQAWAWRDGAGDEAVIGTISHAWLEHLGKQGVGDWTAQRVDDCMPLFRTQLSRAGVPGDRIEAGAQAIRQTLACTLDSATGRWLLAAARGHREWSLVDAAGRVSVIDLALSDEDGWLVVDYKTGVPREGETHEQFSTRMRARHAQQMARYARHLTALDGRPARAALYFPRADIWLDCRDAEGAA